MKAKADLHNHLKTRHNVAEAYTFEEILDLGRNRLGPGGILGIVNFADRRYEQVRDMPGYVRRDLGCGFYVPANKLLVVKGEEVPTKDGHILVFGVAGDKHISLGRSLEETIKEVKDANGIIIADHPFVGLWEGVGPHLEKHEKVLSDFDAIEVYNGEAATAKIPFITQDPNVNALNFYRKKKRDFQHLGAITTSDGHSAAEVGRSYTEMNIPEDCEKIFLDPKTTKDTLTDILRSAIHSSTPEDGIRRNALIRTLMHVGVVMWDHKIRNGDPSMKARESIEALMLAESFERTRRSYSPEAYQKHREALEHHGLTIGLPTRHDVIENYRR